MRIEDLRRFLRNPAQIRKQVASIASIYGLVILSCGTLHGQSSDYRLRNEANACGVTCGAPYQIVLQEKEKSGVAEACVI